MIGVFVCFAATMLSQAQNVPVPASLDVILITATRDSRGAFDLPYSVDSFDATDIRVRRSARTSPAVLDDSPGTMGQKSGTGQGSPFIRGFTGYHTLLLIDGVRLNNSAFRSGPNQYFNTVDPLSLERVELLRGGAGSVLYGSDAVGGVVQALTRDPPPAPAQGLRREGRLLHRFASAESSNVGRLEYGAASPSLGATAGVSAKDFGETVGGRDVGLQPHTGYRELDGDFKLRWTPVPGAKLTALYQRVGQYGAWRTHATTSGLRWLGTVPGTDRRRSLDQGRELVYLKYEGRELGATLSTLEAGVSWQSQSEEQWRIRASGVQETQGFAIGTLGAWAQARSPSPAGVWSYGADYWRDQANSFRENYKHDGTFIGDDIQGPIADNALYHLLGVFAQNSLDFADRRLELLTGGRLSHAQSGAAKVKDPATGTRTSFSNKWESAVGNVRLLCRAVPERLNLHAGLSQGFRTPNLSDLTRFDTAEAGEIETPSPDLRPENFLTAEAGAKARGEGWTAEASYFHTAISDLIVRAPTGNVVAALNEVTKRNAGRGYVHGAELKGRWALPFAPGWSAGAWLGWIYGEADAYPTSVPAVSREPLPKLMPPTGQFNLRWERPDRRRWFETAVRLAGKARKLSSSDVRDTQRIPPGGTPGYAVWSLRGGAELGTRLTVSAAVENAVNQDYRVHASGVNEPGTNFVLTWSVRL